MLRILFSAGMVCLLASCSSFRSDEPTSAELAAIRNAQNVYPESHRADLVAYMRNYLNDPTGVRNAAISQPQVKELPSGARYVSCLRYDARKQNGQYAGTRTALAVYISGKLDRVIDSPPGREPREDVEGRQAELRARAEVREACKDAVFTPFPELQAMRR